MNMLASLKEVGNKEDNQGGHALAEVELQPGTKQRVSCKGRAKQMTKGDGGKCRTFQEFQWSVRSSGVSSFGFFSFLF